MGIYAVNKTTNLLKYKCSNKQVLDIMLEQAHEDIKDYLILQEFDMRYISRITYVDGNCVYNNKEYWTKTAVQNPLTPENFEEHEVLDFLGNTVTYDRYIDEFNNNINRLSVLDGLAGEVEYNITVGNEFIALFRELCVITPLEEITPLQIAEKTANIIPLILTGSFKEAIVLIQHLDVDEFFTEERLNLFINMLKSADSIDYMS